MVMEQGNRGQTISLRLTDQEQEMLAERMKQAGISKKSAYLRKMAMNGYILKLDIPEIREMISLMRYSSNNLNQIAWKLNSGIPMDARMHAQLQECVRMLYEMKYKVDALGGERNGHPQAHRREEQ